MYLEEKNKNIEIKKAIIKLIAFFDLFSYPLTSFEIWQKLKVKTSWSDIIDILNNSKLVRIETKNGFYFLKGRSSIVDVRMKRYNYYRKKIKRARKISYIFKIIPGIKMISLSNIMGDHNLRRESDIDLFIITESGKVWMSRFLCVLIIKFLGLRPKPGNEKDKICLNFFTTPDFFNFKKLRLKDDIYFTYWMVGLDPIYNSDYSYEKFIKENDWLEEELPNWNMKNVEYSDEHVKIIKNFLNLIFSPTEKVFKKIQLSLMSEDLKNKMNKDNRVVINDRILKLHSKDRRSEYMEKYIKNLEKI
ncbi:hypothetical protein K8R62_01375 [bacterium]|nr:hypothetical protein [bacterium]